MSPVSRSDVLPHASTPHNTFFVSSTHYVGYVEDDETPEAIMKKFEALERVQQAQTRGGGGGGEDEGAGGEAGPSAPIVEGGEGLTEEQLLEVFKQTSVFTVKSALAGLEYMHGGGAWAGVAWRRRPPRRPRAQQAYACVRSELAARDASRRACVYRRRRRRR